MLIFVILLISINAYGFKEPEGFRGIKWWCCYKGIDERVVRVSTGKINYDEAVEFLIERKKEVKKGIEHGKVKILNHNFKELSDEYIKWAEKQKSFYSKIHLINQLVNEFNNML